jgi:hypothetical protein
MPSGRQSRRLDQSIWPLLCSGPAVHPARRAVQRGFRISWAGGGRRWLISITFTAHGKTQKLEAGNLLYVPKGKEFTIKGVEGASLLLTVLSPKR